MKNMIGKLLILSAVSLSSVAVMAGDAAAGKTVSARCVACHGVNGEGNAAMVAPKLAGQLEVYIAASLKHFKSGARTNPLMSPMAAPLTDDEIANVAAYYASL